MNLIPQELQEGKTWLCSCVAPGVLQQASCFCSKKVPTKDVKVDEDNSGQPRRG